MIRNPPVAQEMRVQFLAREYPLEEGMATLSSVLAWGTPQTEEHGVLLLACPSMQHTQAYEKK